MKIHKLKDLNLTPEELRYLKVLGAFTRIFHRLPARQETVEYLLDEGNLYNENYSLEKVVIRYKAVYNVKQELIGVEEELYGH